MIRNATIEDINDIKRLGLLVNENFNNVYDLNEYFSHDFNKIILTIKDEKIVGMLMYMELYETCEILNIVVEEDYREKGIATNLIDYMISSLEVIPSTLTLEVNVDNKKAIDLYKKFNFEIINTRKNYYENNDAYLMGVTYERD